MKTSKLTIGIGALWLAVFSGPLHAYLIDWTKSYDGTLIQGYSLGKTGWTSLLPYNFDVGWNRSVQMWQGVVVEGPSQKRVVRGIRLHVMYAKKIGTCDLNVYEGVGVNGRLLSSTKLQWNGDRGEGWYGFKLRTPVSLTGDTYTFSIENLISVEGGGIGFALSEGGLPPTNWPLRPTAFDAPFWQDRFAGHPNGKNGGEESYPWPHGNGRDPGLRGYSYGTVGCRLNYFLLE